MTNAPLQGPGWDDWCYDLDLVPTGVDRAIWIAYWDEELQCNACCTAIRMHNNWWDKLGVYAWRYLHGPPPNPDHPGTGGGHARAVTVSDPNIGRPPPAQRTPTWVGGAG